jgi:hypothetical protein
MDDPCSSYEYEGYVIMDNRGLYHTIYQLLLIIGAFILLQSGLLSFPVACILFAFQVTGLTTAIVLLMDKDTKEIEK